MTIKDSSDGVNGFQTFSTFLALLLPVLQVFFNFLPASSQNVFVIKNILIPVSVIAGIFSYILIIAFKNINAFSIPFNIPKHRAYLLFQDHINYLKNETDEVKREAQAKLLFKTPKRAPFYLTALNVYYALIPLLMFFVFVFLAIGIFEPQSTNKWLILIQAISYIFTVALTSLTLAVFYINESNRKNWQKQNRNRYQKIIQLLFDSNSLPELPKIEFVAQNDLDFTALNTYIRINDKTVYQVTTDTNGDVLKQVLKTASPPESEES